jgi:hypothetical protein
MPEFIRRIRQYVPSHELLQIPSVTIVLRDGAGRVLLARHADRDQWLHLGQHQLSCRSTEMKLQ